MVTKRKTPQQFVIVDRPKRERTASRPDPRAMTAERLVSIRMDMREGRYLAARINLRQALSRNGLDPVCLALLGRCQAETNPACDQAVQLCQDAVKQKRTPETLFQLGMVHLLKGNRRDAVMAFEMGLTINPNYAPILKEFERIGRRRPPLVPFVSRDNFLNRYLAPMLVKAGLR